MSIAQPWANGTRNMDPTGESGLSQQTFMNEVSDNTPLNQYSYMAAMGGIYGGQLDDPASGGSDLWEVGKFAALMDNPFAFFMAKMAAKNVTIPKKEFVQEHERLLEVLKSPSKKDDAREYREQKEELAHVKGAAAVKALAKPALAVAGVTGTAGGGLFLAKEHIDHQSDVARARGEYRQKAMEAKMLTSPSMQKLSPEDRAALLSSHAAYQKSLVDAAGRDPFFPLYM